MNSTLALIFLYSHNFQKVVVVLEKRTGVVGWDDCLFPCQDPLVLELNLVEDVTLNQQTLAAL